MGDEARSEQSALFEDAVIRFAAAAERIADSLEQLVESRESPVYAAPAPADPRMNEPVLAEHTVASGFRLRVERAMRTGMNLNDAVHTVRDEMFHEQRMVIENLSWEHEREARLNQFRAARIPPLQELAGDIGTWTMAAPDPNRTVDAAPPEVRGPDGRLHDIPF